MVDISTWLAQTANKLEFSAYLVFGFNLLIFLFSRQIINAMPSRHHTNYNTRLWTLRIINLGLFVLYILGVVLSGFWKDGDARNVLQKITYTGVVLLVVFMLFHFFHVLLIKRYGREKEIDGTLYQSETYQSEIFSLFGLIIAVITVFLAIINIWNMTSLLQATSVFGGLVLVIYATKDVWAPDNINGLILLYNGNVEPGSLVRIKEYDLLAIVLQTTLTQTVMKDLITRHQIVIPNSKFRNAKIDILTKATAGGLIQYTDFKISYGTSIENIEGFLNKVWCDACLISKAINSDQSPRIRIADTADHAVVWRLFYVVGNVYRLTDVQYAINQSAYANSLEMKVPLQTPLTHTVELHKTEAPA